MGEGVMENFSPDHPFTPSPIHSLIRLQELHKVLHESIAQASVARIKILRSLAHFPKPIGPEHAHEIFPARVAVGFDLFLGQLEMILESEQPILKPKRLVLAELAG